jgi:hypothetical protein
VPRKVRTIVDPENKPVCKELREKGLVVEAAKKGPKVPGILNVADYMHCRPGRIKVIPHQSDGRGGFRDVYIENAPRIWFFRGRVPNAIREHDNWQWHRDQRTGLATNKATDSDDHTADACIYLLRILPPIEKLHDADVDLQILRTRSETSYLAEMARRHFLKARQGESNAGRDELFAEEIENLGQRFKESDNPWLV